jgi:hypothetical protein
MRLSILPSDNAVYVDGLCYLDIDMSWMPKINNVEIHAVQWYGHHGEIELITNDPNMLMKELGIFEKAVKLWEEKHQEQLKIEEEIRKSNLRIEEENLALLKASEEQIINAYDDSIYYDIEELLKEI